MNPLKNRRIPLKADRSITARKLRWFLFSISSFVFLTGCRNPGSLFHGTSLTGFDRNFEQKPSFNPRSSSARTKEPISSVAKPARSSLSAVKRKNSSSAPFDEPAADENSENEPDHEVDSKISADGFTGNRTSHRIRHSDSHPINRFNHVDDDHDDVVKTASFRDDDNDDNSIIPVSANDEYEDASAPVPPAPDDTSVSLKLTFPPEIPGANSPGLLFPDDDETNPENKLAAIRTLFPRPVDPKSLVAPSERQMTLEELEELALRNSPIIAQALASITMSQGTTIQQGLYPNPVVGYEADTVGSSYTRNYQGVYLAQQIKVAGKLGLQRAAANMDLANAQLGYEKTRQDVLHQVRVGYFHVLVAQESSHINEALVRFTNQIYTRMVGRLNLGQQAGYELTQLRTLSKQAYTGWVQSQNRYISAWKQLAVSTGTPELPLANLEGRVDMPVPNLNFDAVLERVLSVHPDLQASRNLISQAKYQLKLQRAIPIPDPTVAGVFQNDSTTPGFQRTSYNLNVSFPLPLYDRNQGNIRNALGRVEMNSRLPVVTENRLTNELADAFERYSNGRTQSELFRDQILPDLARTYRGYYKAHINNSQKVGFSDIIVAQQNLSSGVSSYIGALVTQWVALADIANLMQIQDFRSVFSFPANDLGLPNVGTLPANLQEGGQP